MTKDELVVVSERFVAATLLVLTVALVSLGGCLAEECCSIIRFLFPCEEAVGTTAVLANPCARVVRCPAIYVLAILAKNALFDMWR